MPNTGSCATILIVVRAISTRTCAAIEDAFWFPRVGA